VFAQANNSAVGGTNVLPIPPDRGNARYTAGGGRSGGPETGEFALEPRARGGRGTAEDGSEPAAAGRGRGAGAPPAPGAPAGPGGGLDVQGLPIVKPPYGVLSAINLDRGELSWQVAHGETPDNIRNHAALKGVTIPRTGRQGRIGTLVTKTLLVAGVGGFFTLPDGRRGAMLRAYDKATGQEVGSVYMPAPQTGSPMTYMVNGQQYLLVPISGGTYSGELLALRVPKA
jgi:glucose dehydrogenase